MVKVTRTVRYLQKGDTGRGISAASTVYAVSTSSTSSPTDASYTATAISALALAYGYYVWQATKNTYTDGTVEYTGRVCLGSCDDYATKTVQYAVGSNGTTAPTSGWATTFVATKGYYLWQRTYIQYTTTSRYTTAICIGYYATDGSDGNTVLVYPAGIYSASVAYTRTTTTAPYVLHESSYYIMVKTGTYTGVNPATDYATYGGTGNGTWRLMESIQYAFIEILMASFAKLASAVFYGDYMFSQQGTDASGNSSSNYSLFDPDSNAFTPNILINYLTGYAHFASKKIVLNPDGSIECEGGTFTDVEVTGTVNASAGKIAGFTISGNGLSNTPYENDAYVIFRNDDNNTFAGIGGNVLPTSSGLKAVARFENHDTGDFWGLGTNYGMLLSARGMRTNIALAMDGGAISGMAIKNTIIGESATSVTLTRSDYNVLAINTDECVITLPTMQLYDDGHVIRIKRLGSGALKLRMGYCYTYNGTSSRYTRPVMIYNSNSKLTGTNTISFDSICDAMELVWVRDINYTVDSTTYYGAWVQYKLPRDW